MCKKIVRFFKDLKILSFDMLFSRMFFQLFFLVLYLEDLHTLLDTSETVLSSAVGNALLRLRRAIAKISGGY